ncbi:hypothetical protein RHMOL_Rhmol12G0055000 [Rhododendron molle]|uniref:Uncharacterized protein n=2 Tax=Rhododendron molle TaxID=49168 RepID=A0ACC0LEK4_RHOML|nr:hypothetical protein RHMOL_Rhmol12G0055000 [Rhododendron molle]KAI8527171.1 hypothetical protein RHMOL_Rhmol12G0055000 [Rhododendron molle]
MVMLIRGVLLRSLSMTSQKIRSPSPSFYSSFSPPSSAAKSDVGIASAAADVAPEDLLLDDDLPASAAATATATLPSLLQPRVVVYDGVCHLCHNDIAMYAHKSTKYVSFADIFSQCRAGVKWVIKADQDRKIKFCCLQSQAAEPYMRLCGVDREDVLRRFLFIEGQGSYHQGSTAALKVLSYLPLPYSALSTLLIIPTPLRDAAYDYIAKRRYDWFGKEDDCLVLKEKELLERFIDREEMFGRSKPDL